MVNELISKKYLMKQAFSVYYPLNGENYIKVIRLEDVEKAPTEPRWIPVSERLPEYKKPLLVTYKHYEEYKVAIAHIVEDGFYVTDRETALFNVVAWMPLPSSYQGE